jgi:hypothetical protein
LKERSALSEMYIPVERRTEELILNFIRTITEKNKNIQLESYLHFYDRGLFGE